MREELKDQSRRTKQEREEWKRQTKRNDALKLEFRLATYSQLELNEAEIAALEWLCKRPDILENWEMYSVLRQAYPFASKFISALEHAEPNTQNTNWLKTEAFPDDRFDNFLKELPSLCHDHKTWQDRFKIKYELEEKRRKKRSRFWLSVLAIAILFILFSSISN